MAKKPERQTRGNDVESGRGKSSGSQGKRETANTQVDNKSGAKKPKKKGS